MLSKRHRVVTEGMPRKTQPEQRSTPPLWQTLAFGAVALYAAIWAYSPAFRAPFLFDDIGLPFSIEDYRSVPLIGWVTGVRPMLMFTYWLNFISADRDPLPYRLFNLAVHISNAILVLLILKRLLAAKLEATAVKRLSLFGAGLFLLHPVQTESVAYVAGRSESLCALFILAALAVFTRQPAEPLPWRTVATIVLLYGCAVATKEHAIVLPGAFVFADMLLHGLSVRQALVVRKRLYASIAVVGMAGIAAVAAVLSKATTAGFGIQEFSWHDYFFTQWRVWWLYIALLVFPVRQNADYDIAVSHSPLEHGSILGLAAMVLLLAAAWKLRSRYPLALFGLALCALFLVPTSTIVPIKDLAAERRLYLPVLGFTLILIDVLHRTRFRLTRPALLICGLAVATLLTHQRAKVWSGPIALWSDIVAKSPNKVRGYTHLVYGHLARRQCKEAEVVLSRVPQSAAREFEVLVGWSNIYDCQGRRQEAIAKLKEAAAVSPGPGVYVLMGLAYERAGNPAESKHAFSEALRHPPATAFDREALRRLQSRMSVIN